MWCIVHSWCFLVMANCLKFFFIWNRIGNHMIRASPTISLISELFIFIFLIFFFIPLPRFLWTVQFIIQIPRMMEFKITIWAYFPYVKGSVLFTIHITQPLNPSKVTSLHLCAQKIKILHAWCHNFFFYHPWLSHTYFSSLFFHKESYALPYFFFLTTSFRNKNTMFPCMWWVSGESW